MIIDDLEIEVERKPIKNMHLSVYPPDGRVHLSLPDYLTDADARSYIISKMSWILKQRQDIANQARQSEREYVSVWGYVYNPSTLNASTQTSNGVPTTTVGLVCSHPNRSSYQRQVTDPRYNNIDNNPRTLVQYLDEGSTTGDSYDTYHTYLLAGSGSSLRLAHAPATYLDGQGNVQNAANFPEYFNFYGVENTILGFSWLQQYNAALPKVEINQTDVLALESMPGYTDDVIYLHFAGAGTGWEAIGITAVCIAGARPGHPATWF